MAKPLRRRLFLGKADGKMLTTMVIGATPAGTTYMCQMCGEIRGMIVIRSLESLPLARDLERILDSFAPQLVLIEAGRAVEWMELASYMRDHRPSISVLLFTLSDPEPATNAAATFGLPLIEAPLSGEEFQEAVFHALNRSTGGHDGRVVAFLPSKGGSGATTIALGVAAIAAQRLNKKVLFLECDLRSGPVAYYLEIQPVHSTMEVLENVRWLEEKSLNEFTTRWQGMDVLPSAGIRPTHPFLRRFYDETSGRRNALISAWSCQRLLSRARHAYDLVFCDLPDYVDESFEPILRTADQVVLVSESSTPSVCLAERRISALTQLGAGTENFSVLINRQSGSEECLTQIDNVPVRASLPEDASLRNASTFDLKKIAGSEFESALSNVAELCTRETIPGRVRRKEFSLTSLLSAVTLGWGRAKGADQSERTAHDSRH